MKKNYYKIFNISKLIAKERIDELNPKELEKLSSWLNSSKENRDLYDNLFNEDKFIERSNFISSLDTKSAWENIKGQTKNKGKVVSFNNIWLKIAAVLLISISLVFSYYYGSPVNEIKNEKQLAINPGTTKASLILSSGKVIKIDNRTSKCIQEKNGVDIEINKGVIKYSNPAGGKFENKYNSIEVPKKGVFKVILSDGTQIDLNSASKITLPLAFESNERRIWFNGEAYFEVHHDENIPFYVVTDQSEVCVLGTKFNINNYPENKTNSTTLEEGKVKIKTKYDHLTLKPNQQGRILNRHKNIDLYFVDAKNISKWKEGIFSYKSQKLSVIMNDFARWYGVDVSYESEDIFDLEFSFELSKNLDLNEILNILEKTENVRFDITNNKILVKKFTKKSLIKKQTTKH